MKRDYRSAPIDPRTRALLDHAVRLTREPAATGPKDVERLREAGWTDEEILTATHIVGFFNHYVRIAEGLGVEPEDFMKEARTEWEETRRVGHDSERETRGSS
ncbi:MAG: carboxymuconolactone decarboxylase family protein [Acidimicrobiia bacterium]